MGRRGIAPPGALLLLARARFAGSAFSFAMKSAGSGGSRYSDTRPRASKASAVSSSVSEHFAASHLAVVAAQLPMRDESLHAARFC